MPIPEKTLVREILARGGRDIAIRASIERSWEGVKNLYPERPKWRRKSTTRAVMWESSVESVTRALENDSGIKLIRHHDTVSFIADDTVLFRLKKAALTLFSSNYPTLLAEMFHVHRADLFGFDGHHRVEIVHVFNRFQTALEWIGVVARDRSKVIWEYELPRGRATVASFPPPPPATKGSAADSVLRPAVRPDEKKFDEAGS